MDDGIEPTPSKYDYEN